MSALVRFARRGYRAWQWPKPLWRARGYAKLQLAGHTFRFCDVGRYHGWAGRVHAGTWEPSVISHFSDAIYPGDTVLDVGAWIGPYTLLASHLVGPDGRVFAFEPDPAAHELLRRNIEANHLDNVVVLPYAVGARDESGLLVYDRLGDSQTRVSSRRGDNAADAVTVVSLASFCRQYDLRPSVIKVDVEGAEAEVLAASANSVVAETRALFVELHDAQLRARGSSSEELVERLLEQGGHVTEIMDRGDGRNIAIVKSARPEL